MKTINKIITPVLMSNWFADAMLALPRVIGCYLLATHFGMSKFPVPDWFISDNAKLGIPFPVFFSWAAATSEVIGAFMLVLGLGTRIAAFFLSCTMMVAIFMQQWNNELWQKLPAMGFLWLAIIYMVLGSGRFGLDYLISKKYALMHKKEPISMNTIYGTSF